nr:hypothetical protein [Tanacetum cinerariifolium]
MKMNTTSSSGSRTLPCNIISNPKEDLKGITTRSGTACQGLTISTNSSSLPNNGSTKDVQPLVVQTKTPISNFELVVAPVVEPVATPFSAPKPNQKLLISYPSRLHDQKLYDKAINQKEIFFQIFIDLDFNISFADALILMPKFGPTIKSLLTNKDKLFELARTSLNEHCSTVLLKQLPEKLGNPVKFLILCEFPIMDECLALADLDASINLMPLPVWNKLSLLELTPTLMTLELANPKDLIDVYEGELTLHVGKEAITFNLDQTSRYSASYNDIMANRIDVIDMAYEENSDFLLEEVDAFLALEDDSTSPEVDYSYFDVEAKNDKSSIDEPPEVELKNLPPHLEYAFLEGDDKLPVRIDKNLSVEEKAALIKVLKSHKQAIAWKLFDIKGINPEFYTRKILMEDDFEPAVQHQRRVNPKIHDIIKKETTGDHQKVQLNVLNELRDQAYENSLIYTEKTKRLHDSKIKDHVFNVGDRVLLFNSRLKIFSGKLKTRWSGPFTITQVFPYGTVELSQTNGQNLKVTDIIKGTKSKQNRARSEKRGKVNQDTFYNGLTLRHRDTINAAAGGTFMRRRPEECYDLIENMTAHHNDWDTSVQRSESSSSITSSSDLEIIALKAEMTEINKNLMNVLQINQQVKAFVNNCETCGGPHSYNECPATVGQTQNVYAAGAYNQGGNSYQPQGNRNLLSYRSDNYLGPPGHGQNPPPAYQAPAYQAPVHQASIPQTQVVTTTEFTNYMKTNDAILKNMQTNMTSLKNYNLKLKNMFGQFIKMNTALYSGPGTLPSNIVTNPKEDLKGITTRSGIAYQGPMIPNTSSLPKVVERETEIGRALIDVYKRELTLRVGKEAVTFNLDQTSRYFANYVALLVNRIDLIDIGCEEYSQEVLGFSVSGNPTPSSELIIFISSPTLTPFGDSDCLFEETDAFLAIYNEPISSKIDNRYYDLEGYILLLKEFLNDDPSSPPLPPQELKIVEPKNKKSSIDEPLVIELKDLPPHLEYAFLEGDDK